MVTSREFGELLSVLLPLKAWQRRKDLHLAWCVLRAWFGSSLEFPIPGPKTRHFLGLRLLAAFSAKPSAGPGHWSQTSSGTKSRALAGLRGLLQLLAGEELLPLLLLWDQEASHNKYLCLNNNLFSKVGAIVMIWNCWLEDPRAITVERKGIFSLLGFWKSWQCSVCQDSCHFYSPVIRFGKVLQG